MDKQRGLEVEIEEQECEQIRSATYFMGFWIWFSILPVDSVHLSGILRMRLGFSKISLK